MHPCLGIPEISRMICEEAASVQFTFPLQGTRTLSSLARTCRALSSPALDLLWEMQFSLLPLFKTFPSDLWRESVVELNSRPTNCLASNSRCDSSLLL
jgi:hypothetical protein